jgi:hypothetical protein
MATTLPDTAAWTIKVSATDRANPPGVPAARPGEALVGGSLVFDSVMVTPDL